jgi:DNA/RNA endonuclease YhcR with UshA esterase domain
MRPAAWMVFFRMLFSVTLLAFAAPGAASDHSNSKPFRSTTGVESSSSTHQDPAECLTVAEAGKQVGKKKCVRGTVVHVEEGHNGVTFLDFCADYHSCPFTVVVFRGDLPSIGDVRQLQGRTITIQGRIEEYNDRAEIVLRHPQQLGDSASHLTALPKEYDVERQGHYSAGSFRPSKAKKARHTNQDAPLSLEDPEVP